MKAIIAQNHQATLVHDQPLPTLRPDTILVKTATIALNPTDWKHVAARVVPDNTLIGSDFAGTIVAIGDEVTKPWRIGERVAGVTHGGNGTQPEDGAFAEYILVKGDLALRIPDTLSLEAAATLPLGVATVMQGLYQKGLKLRLLDPDKSPDDQVNKEFVLIYGASTATGALGVQFAKLSGYTVLATASPRNFEYVKGLGADAVFDYSDPNVGAKIRGYTQDRLKLVWDVVCQEGSARISAEALSSDGTGCRYASFLNNKCPRDDVVSVGTNMYTIFGERFTVGTLEYEASTEDFEWAKKFVALTERLLAVGMVKAHRATIREAGLEGAIQGLEDLKNGKASGEKFVYRIDDTPRDVV